MEPNKRPRNDSSGEDEDANTDEVKRQKRAFAIATMDLWGICLPSLVAQKIFGAVANSEEGLPSLSTMSRVNWTWYQLTKELCLLRSFQVPVKMKRRDDQRIIEMVDSWNLVQVQDVDLSGWNPLTDLGIKVLADACPQLTTVNLSRTSVSNAGLQHLVDQCSKLINLNLSDIKTDAPFGTALQDLLSRRGKHLHSLSLASNTLKQFTPVLNLITSECVELKCLDLSCTQFIPDCVDLDVGCMQSTCRKLQSLKLFNSPLTFCNSLIPSESEGFPELEELSVGRSHLQEGMSSPVSDQTLSLLLKASADLKVLNVTGQSSLTSSGLDSLQIKGLESLSIADCAAASLDGVGIIINKWFHSLRQLDLSSNIFAGMSLDMVLQKRRHDTEKSQLRILSLIATQITTSSVRSLLNELPGLTCLQLGGCRGLPRGMQKEFSGLEIDQLRRDVAIGETDGALRATG